MLPTVQTQTPSTVAIKSEPEDLDFMNSEEKRDLYLDSESPLLIEFPQITSSAIESEDSGIETIVCTPITDLENQNGDGVGFDYEYENGTRKSLRQQIQRLSEGDKAKDIESVFDYKADRKSSNPKPRTSKKDIWKNNTERKEEDEYPYKCDKCEKTFTRADVLIRHKRSHTGERPYKCRMCEMTFTRTDHLARHQTTHNEERRHKCDMCGRYYSRLDVLTKHMRIHSGARQHKGDICENVSTRPDELTGQKSHRGKRPYKCDICEKAFTRPDHLTRHNKIHNDEGQVSRV